MVAGPLEQLQLLERQYMARVSKKELLAGSIWSAQLGIHRPVEAGFSNLVAPPLGPRELTAPRSRSCDSCLWAGRDPWSAGAL